MTPKPCKTCGALIVFLPTRVGRIMPTDAASIKPEDTMYDPTRHQSHFVTCPQRDQHRRPRL